MSNRFFYTAVIAFGVGVLIASTADFGYVAAAFLLLLACALFFVTPNRLVVVALILSALGVGYVVVRTVDTSELSLEADVGQEVTIEGTVIKEPIHKERSQQIVVEPEGGDRGYVLVLTSPRPRFAYGDEVVVQGVLKKPESFETDTGRTFDYEKYLAKSNVYYQMLFPDVEQTGSGGGNALRRGLFTMKEKFLLGLNKALPQPHAALAGGLVVGAQEALGDDLLDAFRITGIIHIVVLSGYNVAIVAEAIMRLTRRFLARNIALVLGGVGIVLFAILTGGSATIVRASLMAILVLVARATGRTYDIVRALSLAGFVMILHNPHILAFDPSFQLSFLATLGLIFFSPYIERWGKGITNNFGIREFTAATISTQLFVLPLILYSIGQVSVVAVFVNVLILAMIPLTMLFGFFTGLVGMVSTALALPFTAFSYVLLSYILLVVDIFSRIPFAAFVVPQFPFWAMLAIYGAYVWLLVRIKTKTPPEKTGDVFA